MTHVNGNIIISCMRLMRDIIHLGPLSDTNFPRYLSGAARQFATMSHTKHLPFRTEVDRTGGGDDVENQRYQGSLQWTFSFNRQAGNQSGCFCSIPFLWWIHYPGLGLRF